MIRKLCTGAVALGLCVTAAPVASASASTAAAPASPGLTLSPGLTFVPPSVGPICAVIGEIVLGGKLVSPGLHVCTSGTSPPPIHA